MAKNPAAVELGKRRAEIAGHEGMVAAGKSWTQERRDAHGARMKEFHRLRRLKGRKPAAEPSGTPKPQNGSKGLETALKSKPAKNLQKRRV